MSTIESALPGDGIAPPGFFITFEGVDGSGKTTQMALLAARLRAAGHLVVETQEPGGTAVGKQIRLILLDAKNQSLCPVAEMLLYFAARAQNFDEVILPAWRGGAIVLSDRFTDSTIAYQGAGRGLRMESIAQLHDLACHGLQPNLTIVIDVDRDTAMSRTRLRNLQKGSGDDVSGALDRIEAQMAELHDSVRGAYLQMAREQSRRLRIVSGAGTPEEVADRVWANVEALLSVSVAS